MDSKINNYKWWHVIPHNDFVAGSCSSHHGITNSSTGSKHCQAGCDTIGGGGRAKHSPAPPVSAYKRLSNQRDEGEKGTTWKRKRRARLQKGRTSTTGGEKAIKKSHQCHGFPQSIGKGFSELGNPRIEEEADSRNKEQSVSNIWH